MANQNHDCHFCKGHHCYPYRRHDGLQATGWTLWEWMVENDRKCLYFFFVMLFSITFFWFQKGNLWVYLLVVELCVYGWYRSIGSLGSVGVIYRFLSLLTKYLFIHKEHHYSYSFISIKSARHFHSKILLSVLTIVKHTIFTTRCIKPSIHLCIAFPIRSTLAWYMQSSGSPSNFP
jgi:hypothetical protein